MFRICTVFLNTVLRESKYVEQLTKTIAFLRKNLNYSIFGISFLGSIKGEPLHIYKYYAHIYLQLMNNWWEYPTVHTPLKNCEQKPFLLLWQKSKRQKIYTCKSANSFESKLGNFNLQTDRYLSVGNAVLIDFG